MTKHVFGMTKKVFMTRVFDAALAKDDGEMLPAILRQAEKWFNDHAADEGAERAEKAAYATKRNDDWASGFHDGGEHYVSNVRAAFIDLTRKYHYPQGDVALIPVSELRAVFDGVLSDLNGDTKQAEAKDCNHA